MKIVGIVVMVLAAAGYLTKTLFEELDRAWINMRYVEDD